MEFCAKPENRCRYNQYGHDAIVISGLNGDSGYLEGILQRLVTEVPDLHKLHLQQNQLTELPEGIRGLTALTELSLYQNQLTELPEWIGRLTALTQLDLSANRLRTIPEGMRHLTALTQVKLLNNQLTELPEWIGQLKALTQLDGTNNRFSTIPEGIGGLTALTQLVLSYNQLRAIPEGIGELTALTILVLNNNELRALPEGIGRLAALTHLNVSDNKLRALPEGIGRLTALTKLRLHHNELRALPEGIGRLTTALTQLDLSTNQLRALPEGIGRLTALTQLDLAANQLRALPEGIGHLTALTYLGVNNNELRAIPEGIGHLTALRQLNLLNNPTLTSLPLPNSMVTRSHQLAFLLPRTPAMFAHTARERRILFEDQDVTAIAHEGGAAPVVGQEALTAIRNEIVARWRTYAESHPALLTALMPAQVDVAVNFTQVYPTIARQFAKEMEAYPEEKEEMFLSLNTEENRQLLTQLLRMKKDDADTLKGQHPPLEKFQALSIERKKHFRLATALRGLQLLNWDETMPTHQTSYRDTYRTKAYPGMPTNLQLVVFLYRVLEQKAEETYIRNWLGEEFAKGMEKFPLKTHFPQGTVAEALASYKAPRLISAIVEILQGNDNVMTGSISKEKEMKSFRLLCKKIGKNRREHPSSFSDTFHPLIESLFMTMRGHNIYLDKREEADRPACSDGAYLGSLKAIWETSELGGLAQGLEIVQCGAE